MKQCNVKTPAELFKYMGFDFDQNGCFVHGYEENSFNDFDDIANCNSDNQTPKV